MVSSLAVLQLLRSYYGVLICYVSLNEQVFKKIIFLIALQKDNSCLVFHFLSNDSGATQAPKAGTDLLLDILSIGTPSPAQNSTSSIGLLSIADVNNNPSIALDTLSSPAPPHVATTSSTGMFDLLDGLSPSPSKEATNGPAYAPIVAYESSSLKIEFTFSKTPGNLQTTNVQATFTNLSPNTFTDFIFQAAVPKVITSIFFFCFFPLYSSFPIDKAVNRFQFFL
jgi:hypothetical protein